jgi:hypothetical protein
MGGAFFTPGEHMMLAAIALYRERRPARCIRCTRPVPQEATYCPACGLRVGSPVRPRWSLLIAEALLLLIAFLAGYLTAGGRFL